MTNIILSIWFFVVFIPAIYLFYQCLSCLDFEKFVRRGKAREYKILVLLMSFILASLFALAFVEIIERILAFVQIN